MSDHIRYTFHGNLDVSSFTAFAIHRANRLGLGLTFGACGRAACEMTVDGQAVLVDAFEMAMSLGPIDCIVRDIERQGMPMQEAGA